MQEMVKEIRKQRMVKIAVQPVYLTIGKLYKSSTISQVTLTPENNNASCY